MQKSIVFHKMKMIAAGMLALSCLLTGCANRDDGVVAITNVSYDPTGAYEIVQQKS